MSGLDYKSAGVNLELYEQAMKRLPSLMKRTATAGVMDLPGGFAGLFRLNSIGAFTDPVLVSGTDGVGTKIKLALMLQRFDTIGIDLVAMCVNDCLCMGALPLFFLDYIAMGRDNPVLLEQLVKGISDGCVQAQAALLGGETAIMPDLYTEDDFDMAGFAVAVAEKSELINGKERLAAGDVLIGVPSSGFHSNGYSLIRKAVFDHAKLNCSDVPDGFEQTVGELLLTPTRIYGHTVQTLLSSTGNSAVHGIAHITGGGLCENFERILPDNLGAIFDRSTWQVPRVFTWLQHLGKIADEEMFRVFNMGVGLVVAVTPETRDTAIKACSTQTFPAFEIGRVVEHTNSATPRAVLR